MMAPSSRGPDRFGLELELDPDLEPASEAALGVDLKGIRQAGALSRIHAGGDGVAWETRAKRGESADDDVEELARQVERLANGAPLEVGSDPGVFLCPGQGLGLRDRGGDEEAGAQPAVHLNGNFHLFL